MGNLQTEKYIESLRRAMKAEAKQGYINTGALGGFSNFLVDILPLLKDSILPQRYEELKIIAEEYGQSSPLKRRKLFADMDRLLKTSVSKKAFQEKVKNELNNCEGSGEKGNKQSSCPYQGEKEKEFAENPKSYGGKAGNEDNYRNRITDKPPQSLQYLKGVGPQRVKQLQNLGINTIEELLRYYPRKYEVRVQRRISELKDGEFAVVTGKVVGSQLSRGRIRVVKLNIEQDGRNIYAIWFNQVHIIKQFPVGTVVSVTGKVQWQGRVPEILATDIIKGDYDSQEEIVPVYSETARLNSKVIRTIMKNVVSHTDKYFPEVFPDEEAGKWMMRPVAYREIHFPSTMENMIKARERLVLEEVLFLQLAVSRLRSPSRKTESPVLDRGNELVKKFIAQLPFKLTGAQKRVIQEIFRDMGDKKGMTRLVQGDVGSGKTVVAMAALLQAVGSGYQGAMMAPTEVLALQHYESLKKAFSPLGVEVVMLSGSQTKSERDLVLYRVYSGKAQVVVGTHALIQEAVQFNALGLVITDEQHRFGVRQRTMLQDKGESPHVLVMTATPIPRTLALTIYGDLQLSVLDELPAGRKPVITRKITERSRPSLERFLERQISAGRQVYVVCPLVEETEKNDLVSATERAEKLKKRFPGRKVALLHGRMKGTEKEEIMEKFRNGEIDILVATTVVEVGVNVPNATVMVVEGAERFGLAQLHQLRGRVGRGNEQSYCILVSDARESTRLNILCETEDGFKIAEEDLKLRGPGELLGVRQHGAAELRITDLSRDGKLVEEAYQLLQKVLKEPEKYRRIYEEAEKLYPLDKVGVN